MQFMRQNFIFTPISFQFNSFDCCLSKKQFSIKSGCWQRYIFFNRFLILFPQPSSGAIRLELLSPYWLIHFCGFWKSLLDGKIELNPILPKIWTNKILGIWLWIGFLGAFWKQKTISWDSMDTYYEPFEIGN